MQKLYSGIEIPTTINTNERIFKVHTFDDEIVLCNLDTAYMLISEGLIKKLFHLWNFKFVAFAKKDLVDMYINSVS